VLEKINEMKLEGKSTDDIGEEISKKSKLNHGMVAYILNKAAPA
jgi:hypothetical protein